MTRIKAISFAIEDAEVAIIAIAISAASHIIKTIFLQFNFILEIECDWGFRRRMVARARA